MDHNHFKTIHIGETIKRIVKIKQLEEGKICTYIGCSSEELKKMYQQPSVDSQILLKWSKLLDYNFFRIYDTHLQLYKPSASNNKIDVKKKHQGTYLFKKNIYSPEIKAFIVEKINKKELSVMEAIERYQIPKTTIYRWMRKIKTYDSTSEGTKTSSTSNKKKVEIIEAQKRIGYQNIFTDLLETSLTITSKEKQEFLNQIKKIRNIRHVLLLNKKLKPYISSADHYDYQRLKSYDKAFILYVLRKQQTQGLSNQSIANEYKMSRNTIARWKKVFETYI